MFSLRSNLLCSKYGGAKNENEAVMDFFGFGGAKRKLLWSLVSQNQSSFSLIFVAAC